MATDHFPEALGGVGPVVDSVTEELAVSKEPAAPEPEAQTDGAKPLIYAEFFGFREAPFNLTPDARFLFLTPPAKEALSNLRYGLATGKGLTVMLGDAGTGKTTLVRAAVGELGNSSSRYVLLSNPTLCRNEFYEFLSEAFGFTSQAARSKTRFLAELQADVRARSAKGGITGLIVDEAQSMPYELLEEIRLLGNIETPSSKLLNIVLSGQPELADRLNEPGLRQLKQRVALRCTLKPLTLDEAMAYVAGRIRIAGGQPAQVFTADAVSAIHAASRGIPRSVNVLCDNALISGFAAQIRPISSKVVAEVCRDFDLHGEAEPKGDPSGHRPAPAAVKPAPKPVAPTPSTDREMFRSVAKPRSKFSFFG
jgi:type II secretory pathway predicted ATPase ExeA